MQGFSDYTSNQNTFNNKNPYMKNPMEYYNNNFNLGDISAFTNE